MNYKGLVNDNNLNEGCARFSIFWMFSPSSLSLFHSLAPELQVFVNSLEISAKRAHPCILVAVHGNYIQCLFSEISAYFNLFLRFSAH